MDRVVMLDKLEVRSSSANLRLGTSGIAPGEEVSYHNQCPERVVKKDGGRDSEHGESDEAIKL